MWLIQFIKSIFYGRSLGAARSGKWRTVRKRWLKQNPYCAVCGREKRVVPHHKKPFHLFPEKELDWDNLITLCERRKVLNCHLIFGHLGAFRKYNSNIEEDVELWKSRLQ